MAITLSPSKESLGILAKIEGSVPFVDANGDLIEDNPNLFWDDTNNRLGIGTASPNVTLEVRGTPGASVGGFPSGAFHITNPSASVNANAVITGHNLFGGNKQLWYLGSISGSTDDIALINRQNAALSLLTNSTTRMTIDNLGNVGIGVIDPDAKLEINGQLKITGGNPGNSRYLRSDANGLATWGDVGWTDLGTDVVLLNSSDNVGIGTATPAAKLEVAGQVKITGGTPGVDKVLTSDAVGLATWKVAPGAVGATVFAQLSSSVDQEPTVLTPTVITYNTQDDIVGLTHSTTVNPGEITIVTAGTYFVLAQPQVGKSSGGAAQTLNMFMQVDRGSGFVDEPNTNIKVSVSDNTATDVIVLGISIVLAVGDKLRKMQRITNSTVGLGLKFTAAEVGPPTIPATPSIILTMFRIGA